MMNVDQLFSTAQTVLGPQGMIQLRDLLIQRLPVSEKEAPKELGFTVEEISMIAMLRGYINSQDEGKQLVSLLGKFHRYAQSEVDKLAAKQA